MGGKDIAYWGAIAPIPTAVHFGGEAIPVVLEIQDGQAELAITGEAAQYSDEKQREYQEQVSRLARAVLAVRDDTVVFDADPKQDLARRLAWAASWPDPFVLALHDAYMEASTRVSFARAALEQDPNREAQSASASGGDSGRAAISAPGASPQKKRPTLSSIRNATSTTSA